MGTIRAAVKGHVYDNETSKKIDCSTPLLGGYEQSYDEENQKKN